MTGFDPVSYPYSSYQYYLGNKTADWIKPEFILSYFENESKIYIPKSITSYQKFVNDYIVDSKEIIGSLALDEE